jgi:hypothetical protein
MSIRTVPDSHCEIGRTARAQASGRLPISAVVLCAVMALSGCASPSPASTDGAQTRSAAPTESSAESSASPTPTAATRTLPAELSFEAGSVLSEGVWETGWAEILGNTAGFSVESPDDGNGSFSYVDDTTGCRISFYQGTVTDLDLTQDDRALSDDFLATMMNVATGGGVTREDVAANAYDDVAGRYPDSGTVSTRTIWLTGSEGETLLSSTRMFAALGGGVYIGILCPAGQSAQTELENLMTQYVAIRVEPATSG